MPTYHLAKIWPAQNWPHDRDRLEIIATFPTAKAAVRAHKHWNRRVWGRPHDPNRTWFHAVAIKMWREHGLGYGSWISLPSIPDGNYGPINLELDAF